MVVPQPAESTKKKPEIIKSIRGFKLWPGPNDTIRMQLPLEPRAISNQKLISAIALTIARISGQEIEKGILKGWFTTSVDVLTSGYERIVTWMAFPTRVSLPSVGLENDYIENMFWELVLKRMLRRKNYEFETPKGNSFFNWAVRDFFRYLYRYATMEQIREYVYAFPRSRRHYTELRFHDVRTIKSVLSITEWDLMNLGNLSNLEKESEILKRGVTSFRDLDYGARTAEISKVIADMLGKPCLSLIYARLRLRSTLKRDLTKKTGKDLAIPLEKILLELRQKKDIAGVHLLPTIIKFRQNDLLYIKKVTILADTGITGADDRFTTVEDYLKYAITHPEDSEGSSRVVTSAKPREFYFPVLD